MIELNAAWTPYLSSFSSPMVVVVKDAASAPVWTTYMAALSTPLLALVAAYIAYRQWRTAQNKLKLDLFEKRLAVYQAVTHLMIFLVFEQSEASIGTYYELCGAVDSAKFLFDKRVAEFVDMVKEASGRATTISPVHLTEYFEGKTKEECERWLVDHRSKTEVLFGPYLRLSH